MREHVMMRLETSDRISRQLGVNRFASELEDAVSAERRENFKRKQVAATNARRTHAPQKR